eukprot:228315-Chlamydomonas_euryale.AAC.1
MSERLKEQQEMERKLAKAAKQLDHFERARREEEVPLLNQLYAQRMEEDRAMHEEQQAAFLAAHRAAWEVDVQEKARLATMLPEKAAFAAAIMARREGEFKVGDMRRGARARDGRRMRARGGRRVRARRAPNTQHAWGSHTFVHALVAWKHAGLPHF